MAAAQEVIVRSIARRLPCLQQEQYTNVCTTQHWQGAFAALAPLCHIPYSSIEIRPTSNNYDTPLVQRVATLQLALLRPSHPSPAVRAWRTTQQLSADVADTTT
jgi:hypothetical protein